MSSPTNPPPTLHVLNKTPQHSRFSACMAQLAEGDTLLLLEDGVLALQHPVVGKLLSKLRVLYAFRDDAEARGVGNKQLQLSCRLGIVQLCSMEKVVELTATHTHIINW